MSLITRHPDEFIAAWHALPAQPWGPATARGVMLMAPDGLSASASTCADNRYMDASVHLDPANAQVQHRALARALSDRLPVWTFPGDDGTPDATFLNNAFATTPGRLILGAMRYPERQRETSRRDVRAFFTAVLGYDIVDLGGGPHVAELTGSLVIDRRRGVGFCGLGERCDLAGAQAMHDAFGLRLTFAFDLAATEYHTNVVMSILGGRTLVLCADGLADGAAAHALLAAYGDQSIALTVEEKNAFAGNCIAVDGQDAWMSAAAAAGLTPSTRNRFTALQWPIRTVDLSEIEKAGGSLRCCVAELY